MNFKPLVIFEMANNHMGDLDYAKRIINTFFKTSKPFAKKIDFAFKFQFRNLDTYVHSNFKNSKDSQVKRFLDTRLADTEWKNLIKFTKKKFKIICTAFDEDSVDKVIHYKFDYLKIASCSMDEWPLLEHIAKKAKKKKIICSLGGASLSSIRNNISFFSSKNLDVKYLYCVAKYPTRTNNLNLEYFKYLKNLYGDKILGYSTHEEPNENLTAALIYAMGGRIFEKHVGINSKIYHLNKYSSDNIKIISWLENLSKAIDRCGNIENREKFLSEEQKNLSVFKRGVYLKDYLSKKKDQHLKIQDIDFAFPSLSGQLNSNDFSKFKEFKLKKNINASQPVFKKDLIITDSREFIEIIRDKISNLILRSGVIVNKNCKLEISHHYGLDKFYKFGLTMITIFNSGYCKKLLFLFYNQKHPPQYHKEKQETFFILSGKVRVLIVKKNRTKNIILKTGDIMTIYPNELHSFQSISREGSIIEELSTTSKKDDSFYSDNLINRNKNRKSFISLN